MKSDWAGGERIRDTGKILSAKGMGGRGEKVRRLTEKRGKEGIGEMQLRCV